MAIQNTQSSRPIKRLDFTVVSKIAAGEVVLRPANAIKELIENSLDAGATSIKVEVKDGGMKYIEVVDNGCGIRREDLDIVCEKHTTSKLESIADLQSVNTYGFRGEALASISLISNVSLLTKTAEERCGFKVSYSEGKLKDKPVPCAANQGTTITVENIFYNVPLRQKSLKNFFEEHRRVQDIVGRYAVHNASVGFSLKKYGQNHLYVNTINNSSIKDVIGSVFDINIARNLLEKEGYDDTLQFKYRILATSLIYSAKQMIFLLFINNRLVKAEGLQKEVVELYSIYLPLKAHPFIYISLEMPPANVDPNIHPRKENVFYLHEESINKKILMSIQQLILGKDAYKTYKQETLSFSQTELAQKDITTLEDCCPVAGEMISAANNVTDFDKGLAPSEEMASAKGRSPEKSSSAETLSWPKASEHKEASIRRKEKNATTSQTKSFKKGVKQSVEQIPKSNGGNTLSVSHNIMNSDVDADTLLTQEVDFELAEIMEEINDTKANDHAVSNSVTEDETEESSMLSLLGLGVLKKNIIDSCDRCLKSLLEASTFVACSDYDQMLIAKEDNLYECVLKDFCKEYFYQVIINDIGDLSVMSFSEPVPLCELLQNAPSNRTCSLEAAQQQLMKNADVLNDYYCIKIDENGNLLSLPWLLEGYYPSKQHLPEFILQLACDVLWDEDHNCLGDVCLQIASYYSKFPSDESPFISLSDWNNLVESTVFPAVQKDFWPSKELYLKSICEVHV